MVKVVKDQQAIDELGMKVKQLTNVALWMGSECRMQTWGSLGEYAEEAAEVLIEILQRLEKIKQVEQWDPRLFLTKQQAAELNERNRVAASIRVHYRPD